MPSCKDCDTSISPKSKGGRCRTCANRVRVWSPEARAQTAERSRATWRRHLADPVNRQIAVEAGKRLKALYPNDDILHHQPAAVIAAAEKIRAWCPLEYRELDDSFRRKGIRLADRKTMIADRIEADKRQRIADMTPFERQMWRLQNGAKLIEVQPLRRSGYDYSLTGSSAALL